MDKEIILIWTNIALIATVIGAIIRLVWFMSKLDSRVDLKANSTDLKIVDNKADKAHDRIDNLKEILNTKGVL